MAIDRIFSANVLAARIDPNRRQEWQQSDTLRFITIKEQIVSLEKQIEPLIILDCQDDRKPSKWLNDACMRPYAEFRKCDTIETLIDLYLVNFEKSDPSKTKTTLV